MTWLWAALVLAVLGGTLVVAAGRGDGMSEGGRDRAETRLPEGRRLTEVDLRGVRFNQTLRGYAMDEVDDFVDRLRCELARRPAAESSTAAPAAEHEPACPPAPPRPPGPDPATES